MSIERIDEESSSQRGFHILTKRKLNQKGRRSRGERVIPGAVLIQATDYYVQRRTIQ